MTVHVGETDAFSTFQLLECIEELSNGGISADGPPSTTPVFLQLTAILNARRRRSSDASDAFPRDPCGYSLKMYTEGGTWSISGDDKIPAFLNHDIDDMSPEVTHASKLHRSSPAQEQRKFQEFVSMHHHQEHTWSSAAERRFPSPKVPKTSSSPGGGCGVNTCTLTNAIGQNFYVKLHFTPEQRIRSLMADDCLRNSTMDSSSDFLRAGLHDPVGSAVLPRWRFGIQVIPEVMCAQFPFDVCDPLVDWPENLVPVKHVGELELSRDA